MAHAGLHILRMHFLNVSLRKFSVSHVLMCRTLLSTHSHFHEAASFLAFAPATGFWAAVSGCFKGLRLASILGVARKAQSLEDATEMSVIS